MSAKFNSPQSLHATSLQFILLFFILCSLSISAQTGDFTKIILAGSGEISVSQSDHCTVKLSGEEKPSSTEWFTIKDGTLRILNPSSKVLVNVKNPESLELSGVGKITVENSIKTDHLSFDVSGSGKITAEVVTKNISVTLSGTGKIILSGKTDILNAGIPGSGKIDAEDLITRNSHAMIGGIGKINCNAKDSLTADIGGSGKIIYHDEPKSIIKTITGTGSIVSSENDSKDDEINSDRKGSAHSDTTNLKFGNSKIIIIHPSTSSGTGKIDSTSTAKTNSHRPRKNSKKVSPHWSGIDIGLNGISTTPKSVTLPVGYDFLELNENKSVCVGLNMPQFNTRLIGNYVWFVSGLGINWNNYRFAREISLVPNSDSLRATYDGISYTKNKLTVSYLTMPLMLEFFDSQYKKNAVHLETGVILGYKIGSHTKQVYTIDKQEYRNKVFNDYNLNPLRCDFTVRFGFRSFNLFANYAITSLFKTGKAPDMHSYSVGLSVIGF